MHSARICAIAAGTMTYCSQEILRFFSEQYLINDNVTEAPLTIPAAFSGQQ
jgi:hypothetical protein